ncbi:MAG: hypothetical protein WCP98_04235 [Actinomycetes bacterium]
MPDRLQPVSFDIVLLDASVIVNFCSAGHGRRLASYFGAVARLSCDVQDELLRLARSSPAVRALLAAWPVAPPLELSAAWAAKAAAIRALLRAPGDHANAHAGEVATVLLAEQLRADRNVRVLIVVDDRDGKMLAQRFGLPYRDTPQLIIEMVVAGALTEADGRRVWRECFSDRGRWAGYRARLAEARSAAAEHQETEA